MSEREPPAPGWWQASDNNWYPPESHADHVPTTSVPPTPLPAPTVPAPTGPAFSGPASSVPPPPLPAELALASAGESPQTKPWWQRWWTISIAAILVLVVAVGIAGSSSDDLPSAAGQLVDASDEARSDQQAAAGIAGDADSEPETATETDDGDAAGSIQAGVTEPAPVTDPQLGTRENPLAFDALVPITFSAFGDADGSVWNVLIGQPRDITDLVVAENSFNDPPPDGVRFVGFDVVMTLAAANKEPLSSGFNFTWEILGGATAAVYDSSTVDGLFGCGVSPDDYDPFAEVFVGGTLTGTVCIPLPAQDLDAPGTVVAMNFRGDRIVFAIDGARPSPVEVSQRGQSSASTELGYGAEVPVMFSNIGDADRSVWNVTIGSPRDVGQDIVAESAFNDPPPAGVSLVGFDVAMTLASAGKEPLSPGFNFTWEILGGATSAVYDQTTMSDLFGCGVAPNEFNDFAEVFVGGTLTGLVCIPIPTEDIDHPDTRFAMNFAGKRTIFFDGGPTPAPVEIVPGAGPAGVGESLPLGIATDIEWDTFGDADRSTWSTTFTEWRDMTAEVMAENAFNDPPPAGVIYAGFDVEMTLIGAEKEPLSTGFNFTWEVLGADTNRVYDQNTLGPSFGCGVTPNEFDSFDEVFEGGTLTGTICIPIPAADFAAPGSRIAMNFSGDRVTFAPNE